MLPQTAWPTCHVREGVGVAPLTGALLLRVAGVGADVGPPRQTGDHLRLTTADLRVTRVRSDPGSRGQVQYYH